MVFHMELIRFHEAEELVRLAWNYAMAGAPVPVMGSVSGGRPALVWQDADGKATGAVYLDAFGTAQPWGNPPRGEPDAPWGPGGGKPPWAGPAPVIQP